MTMRASTPSFSRARAWWSACSGTPPQNDHEYGTIIPTFMRGDHARVERPAGRRSPATHRNSAGAAVACDRPTRLGGLRRLARLRGRPPRIDARARQRLLVHVQRVVAGREVTVAVVHQGRLDLGADLGRVAATRVEATTGRRVDRRG